LSDYQRFVRRGRLFVHQDSAGGAKDAAGFGDVVGEGGRVGVGEDVLEFVVEYGALVGHWFFGGGVGSAGGG